MNTKPADVDAYLSTLPDDARGTLEGLRRLIKAMAPDAVEGMGYGIPGFKYRGRPLVYFAAAKNHCALYGLSVDEHQDELAAYDTSRGTIRFPPGQPPPEALVKTLVSARMAAIETAAARLKRKKPGTSTSS
jgi:uncharacterized protein YdhG (YjbR/CyaY superfamily)